ncbi:MAG TPA: GNAT family N-acetyltransferase [Bryobacteraceae bacterium]|nr:GNAT family N-acetyltransferase [Bryobacteraceae bacterium]
MAARLEAAPRAGTPEVVPLRQLRAAHLEPLLEEEVHAWREALDWDFSKSADLVRRFVDMHALQGFALLEAGQVIGYSYYVLEDRKGLIGDLYVRLGRHSPALELRLLRSVVGAIMQSACVRRIESQLMMARWHAAHVLPAVPSLTVYERNFMRLDFGENPPPGPPRRAPRPAVFLERWNDQYQESAAQLIAEAYEGHVDSLINDQYRSLAGARRFLFNIVQYPGCGIFFRPASLAAFDAQTGRMCGICLTSIVAEGCGHITQICVAPRVRAGGVGYALLQQSLASLHACGCRKISLTVTASNQEAVSLYESVGFRTVRKFSALVWEGF